jgi:hypothetical protein
MKPIPAKPRSIIAQVDGSGTAAVSDNETGVNEFPLPVPGRSAGVSVSIAFRLIVAGPKTWPKCSFTTSAKLPNSKSASSWLTVRNAV